MFFIFKIFIVLLFTKDISLQEIIIGLQIIFCSYFLSDNELNRRYIAMKINKLGIIPTKLAQWMGHFLKIHFENVNGFKLFINSLPFLQSDCPVTPSILYDYHVQKFSNVLKSVEQKPFASASIAQIYRGKTHNDEDVVIKIKHDGILKNIQRWENICNAILKYQKLNINTKHFFENIKDQINFVKEGENLKHYYRIYRKNKLVEIPKYYDGDSDVLIMSYLPSENFHNVQHMLSSEEEDYYIILSRIIYQDNIFIKDVIHMDLHNGNWGICRENKSIVLYDFGWVLKDQSDFKRFFILAHLGRLGAMNFFLQKYNVNDKNGELIKFVDSICEDHSIDILDGIRIVLKMFPDEFEMDNFMFCVLSLCVFFSSLTEKFTDIDDLLESEINFMEKTSEFIPLCSLMKRVQDPETKKQLQQWYSQVENSPNRNVVIPSSKVVKID